MTLVDAYGRPYEPEPEPEAPLEQQPIDACDQCGAGSSSREVVSGFGGSFELVCVNCGGTVFRGQK